MVAMSSQQEERKVTRAQQDKPPGSSAGSLRADSLARSPFEGNDKIRAIVVGHLKQ